MRRSIRLVVLSLVVAAAVLAWRSTAARPAVADTLPARFTDAEFWSFTERMSEPNGYFRSDNFLSNERAYQTVIPELVRLTKPGGVYLGVGPEQNFPYIIALRPKLAVIFDIRRGNLHIHLLYKALFELSEDRADFLSRLWSRARPAWLTPSSSIGDLMGAYRQIPPTPEAYAENLRTVMSRLTDTHHFALRPEDAEGIDFVYRTAFYEGGPDLLYSMRGGGGPFGGNGGRRMNLPYADIQMQDDGTGVNRGFLATEEHWRAVKDLQERNLIVPVVGDFGGPSAIRSVGKYLRDHGTTVSAFYLSNVEQYLNQDGKEDAFLCNVATLPLDETSTFIYTGGGRYGRRGGGGGFGGALSTTFLRPMLPDTRQCTTGVARLWR